MTYEEGIRRRMGNMRVPQSRKLKTETIEVILLLFPRRLAGRSQEWRRDRCRDY